VIIDAEPPIIDAVAFYAFICMFPFALLLCLRMYCRLRAPLSLPAPTRALIIDILLISRWRERVSAATPATGLLPYASILMMLRFRLRQPRAER